MGINTGKETVMKSEMFIGLLFCAVAAAGFAAESDGIFAYKVGQFEVFMLVESERDGNTSIIPGADEAMLRRHIPASGFKHTANAFLVKAHGKNILIDTGTGANGVIVDKIKKLGVEPENVDAVLITHMHGDHFSGLQKDGKALFPNATIYLSERELEYWTKTNVNQGAVAALAPYGSQVKSFEPSEINGTLSELLPGIIPIANYGHTPGHTVFMVTAGSGERLVIIGDLLHVALVQFPNPDISASYDMNPKAAAVARWQILGFAAKNKIPVGGMHIVYPGVGMVEPAETGYKFVPLK